MLGREQAELLAARNLGMTRVLVLEASDYSTTARASAQLAAKHASGAYLFPTPDSSSPDTSEGAAEGATIVIAGVAAVMTGAKSVAPELTLFNEESVAIRMALLVHRDIEQCVNAEGNRTRVQAQVRESLLASALGRQAYLEKRQRGHPAPMVHQRLWMNRDEVVERRSRFSRAGGGALGGDGGGDYCPVSWKLDRTLLLVPPDATLSNMLQIGAEVVCVSAKHRRELLASPGYYMRGSPLPSDLPRKLQVDEALMVPNDVLKYKGYCPVTLYDGPGTDADSRQPLPIQEAIKRPTVDEPELARSYVAEYAGNKYRMLSEEKLQRFMLTPWTFVGLHLPVKLPLEVKAIDLSALPLVGYLEQTVVDELTLGLLSLGRAAPRFPGLTGKESGLKYLALHLRANKSTNTPLDARLHAANLQAYKEACAVLSRDAKGAQMPTPLKPADPIVDKFFELLEAGPKACTPN
mmetsp:Transcript_8089/g.12835  ORF Transcript_8089/g.12835 Transcript_8089/m.12835 type:complete len:465 (+) Transcript_8089:12-1406(+)